MSKVGGEIEYDIMRLVRASALRDAVNGDIYLQGARPIGSNKEDIVISFMDGLDAQIQTGIVTINIYVPDIDNGTGVLVKNTSRCRELERIAYNSVKQFKSYGYYFSLGWLITSFPEPDIHQHFVNVRIRFKLKC